MKNVCIWSVCLLLGSELIVKAAMIDGVTTAGNIDVQATWDTNDAEYDVVDIYIKNLKGPATNAVINAIEGQWTATGGKLLTMKSLSLTTAWKLSTTNGAGGDGWIYVVPGQSFVNFSATIPVAIWGRDGFNTTQTSYIKGSWNNGMDPTQSWATAATLGRDLDPDGNGMNNNIMAELYVTKGTTKISFGGTPNDKFGYNYGGGETEVTAFSVVPEPSTLTLLGMGGVGLLGYAWRRRKQAA